MTEKWEQRMVERRAREVELFQRKEAAAKALLERERKKSEHDRAEIERLTAQQQILVEQHNELKSAYETLQQASAGSPYVDPVQATKSLEQVHPFLQAWISELLLTLCDLQIISDEGIFERHRKKTITVKDDEKVSPRCKITTLQWVYDSGSEQNPEVPNASHFCLS